VAANVLVLIFRAYLSEQTIEHLSGTLRRGTVRDLLAFFPPTKRDGKALDAHFRAAGLPAVAEWWLKKQTAVAKEAIVSALKEAGERGDSPEEVCAAVSRRDPAGMLSTGRWSPSSRRSRRTSSSPSPSSSSASGRASWRRSTGPRARTSSRASPCARSPCAAPRREPADRHR
jgi:hypothetical protein